MEFMIPPASESTHWHHEDFMGDSTAYYSDSAEELRME